jgi:hypothetical protein
MYHLVPRQEIHDAFRLLYRLFQPLHDLFAAEELDKRLLAHVSASGAPADDSVVRLQTVNCMLGPHGPPPVLG